MMSSLLKIACLSLSLLFAKAESERPASVFKVGPGADDWLALPEVFSNLDFEADNTPAAPDDIEGQLTLRASRFWGRLYIDGWPQSIQFFRAHFGHAPPMGKKIFVFAEPRDACTELQNAHLLTENHVVLANRGTCTYGTKALNVKKTNAPAIIIINNEPGIDHLPGPDAHDIELGVVSISQQEGALLESVYDEGPADEKFGRKIEGYLVPMNCIQGGKCAPATEEEKVIAARTFDGGIIHVHVTGNSKPLKEEELPIEYLNAHFGTMVLHSNVSKGIVMAKPAEACEALEKDVKGKIVLVRRGSCPFVNKVANVQDAGGLAIIIGGQGDFLVRMGVEPRWKGLNTIIPVVMVTKRSFNLLVAESYANSFITFEENSNVNSTVWASIEKLSNGEGWPRSEAFVTKKYNELVEEHVGWPDRLHALKSAYNVHPVHLNKNSEL